MADGTRIRVDDSDLRALLRATDNAGKETKKLVRSELRKAAEPALVDARARLRPISVKSAGKLGISIRKVGTVTVEQRLRRTTGLRKDFGALQMRKSLLPALAENADEVTDALADVLDRQLAAWGRGG